MKEKKGIDGNKDHDEEKEAIDVHRKLEAECFSVFDSSSSSYSSLSLSLSLFFFFFFSFFSFSFFSLSLFFFFGEPWIVLGARGLETARP